MLLHFYRAASNADAV